MPSATLHPPVRDLPGITSPHVFNRRLPDILKALEHAPMSDARAQALADVARDWKASWTWFRNEATEARAFYAGEHYGYLEPSSGLWVGNTLDAEADRVRLTVNALKACVDQGVAMATGDDPVMRAAAGQPGVAASAAAEVGRAFNEDAWKQHRLSEMYRDTFRTKFVAGMSYVLLEWDATAGPLRLMGYKPIEPDSEPDADQDDALPVAVGGDGSLVPPPEAAPATSAVPPLPGGQDASAPPSPAAGATSDAASALAAGPQGAAAPEPPGMEPVEEPQGELRYRMLMDEQVAHDPASRQTGGADGIGVYVEWKESRARILELLKSQGREDLFDELEGENSHDAFGDREERTQRSSSSASPTLARMSGERDVHEDLLKIGIFYLRSRDGRRRGDCLMFCGGKMLYEGENDVYPTIEESARGELWPAEISPVFAFGCDARENCPLARGRVVDAVPVQTAINGYFSKEAQHFALIANVKYVLPAGLDFEPNDEPGQVARVPLPMYQRTGDNPVRMTSPPQMPDYRASAENLIKKLEYVMGVNAASMGQAPSREPSGVLTDRLQQRDDTRISPLMREHDDQWARLQTYAMRLYRRHDPDGVRMLRMIGSDFAVAMKFFKVADMAAGTEIYSVSDTSLPRDPARRILATGNIVEKLSQLAANPEMQDAYLEMLALPDMVQWQERRSPHKMKAIRNNRLLLLGQGEGTPPQPAPAQPGQPPQPQDQWPQNMPLPAPWDNPMIHKAELERFLCSPDYLDRVAAEKGAPENMGQSPLEQRATRLWSYWAQKAVPAPTPPQVKLVGQLTDAEVASQIGAPPPAPAAAPSGPLPMRKAA